MEENWLEQFTDEERACIAVTNDLESDTRTCPACLHVFAAGPTHCPSCRLFIGG